MENTATTKAGAAFEVRRMRHGRCALWLGEELVGVFGDVDEARAAQSSTTFVNWRMVHTTEDGDNE